MEGTGFELSVPLLRKVSRLLPKGDAGPIRWMGIITHRLSRETTMVGRGAVRELFPASEATWRVPTLLLFSGSGMAFGGWLAGAIYDTVGFYAAAFAAGIAFNFAHLMVIGTLVWRQRRSA